MIHHFPTFEIDEAQRELRTDGRVLRLQPRIFDLLVYLVRNRDRVVPKDELLDSVWPGVIVTDGSLQRAVSLARGALTSAGAPDAIRTFARHGYRFCAPSGDGDEDACPEWNADALHRRVYEMHFAGQSQEALDELERVVADQRAKGDHRAEGWACMLIGLIRLERRELALARGWHRHAARLLEAADATREQGYADLLGFRLAFFENEMTRALDLAERARAAGAACGDCSLEGLGLIGVGEANLMIGRTRQGLDALDEAGAAVVAGGMSTWATGLVYCGVIYCCMNRSDWNRASQWTDQFDRWGRDKGAAGYPGLCRLHRAQVLTIRGELGQAMAEINAVRESLIRSSPWMEGEVWRVTGEIHTASGDFEQARICYQQATSCGFESGFEIALLKLLDGDPAGAAANMRSLIDAELWSCQTKRGQAWAQYAIASAQAGDPESARFALENLAEDPELVSTPALQLLVNTARAELELAEGRPAHAVSLFRSALTAGMELDAPLATAQIRCRLARVLIAANEDTLAKSELSAAKAGFRKAGAPLALRRCERLFRRTQRVRPPGSPVLPSRRTPVHPRYDVPSD